MYYNSESNFNWEKWKGILGTAIVTGKKVGMSDEGIEKTAKRIGDFLALTAEPESESERLMLNFWKIADTEERKVLARMIIKLVSKNDSETTLRS